MSQRVEGLDVGLARGDGTTGTTPPPGEPHVEAKPRREPVSRRDRLAAAHWLTYPASVFLVSRVVVMGAVWAALRIRDIPFTIDVLKRWDGSWYVMAAQDGYSAVVPALQGGINDTGQSTHAFFPLLPFLLRSGHRLGLSYVWTALAINTIAGLVAAALVWRLVAGLADRDTADRAVLIFCFFPGAYVFTLVYAEGIMLALALGCILALRSRHWVTAGLLAALATAARPNALILVLCCAWEAGRFIWQATERRRALIALAAPALAPLGALAFLLFLWRRTGDPLTWLTVQKRGWGQTTDPSYPIDKTLLVLDHPLKDLNVTVSVIGLAIILVTGYLFVRTRPPVVLWIYTIGIVAMALGGNSFAHPRFILTAFPLVIAIAQRLRWPALSQVLTVSVAMLTVLTMAFMTTTLIVP